MITNYGEICVPSFDLLENKLISLNSDKNLNYDNINDNGYCIFKSDFSNLIFELEKKFTILKQNEAGNICMPVMPIKGENNIIHTRNEQPLHCDNAHSGTPPDFICLFCESNSTYGGESIIKKIDENFLIPDLESIFSDKITYVKNKKSYDVFLLEYLKGKIYSSYSPFCDYYELLNIKQYYALKKIHEKLFESPMLSYKIKPNEVIILNNRKFLHGRTKLFGNRKMLRL